MFSLRAISLRMKGSTQVTFAAALNSTSFTSSFSAVIEFSLFSLSFQTRSRLFDSMQETYAHSAFFYVELLCNVWFIIELFVRFFVSAKEFRPKAPSHAMLNSFNSLQKHLPGESGGHAILWFGLLIVFPFSFPSPSLSLSLNVLLNWIERSHLMAFSIIIYDRKHILQPFPSFPPSALKGRSEFIEFHQVARKYHRLGGNAELLHRHLSANGTADRSVRGVFHHPNLATV